MSDKLPVTAVIINFKTADVTRRAITSFRRYYPAIPLLLIDNGSRDESTVMLNEFKQQSPGCTEVIINDTNLHHGPAMNQALHYLRSSNVLFLDSDCEIHKGGFLEAMIIRAEEHTHHYAVGKRVFMNRRGFDVPESNAAISYIRPLCMLLKREVYVTLPAFQHHGTPCLANMREAARRGLVLVDFPGEEYLIHVGRATAGKYGYNLGWRGKLNHLLNKIGL